MRISQVQRRTLPHIFLHFANGFYMFLLFYLTIYYALYTIWHRNYAYISITYIIFVLSLKIDNFSKKPHWKLLIAFRKTWPTVVRLLWGSWQYGRFVCSLSLLYRKVSMTLWNGTFPGPTARRLTDAVRTDKTAVQFLLQVRDSVDFC